ncbi:MAG: hypothetical protein OJF60_002306 [Burkholderiaceae bacterium]|jgi:aryl-alcohol dehydrogenase-like predicted oxidoreductase|nr:MAG: hypothetical protein OJF60_002306 [Burkholderiaceae bacterium]
MNGCNRRAFATCAAATLVTPAFAQRSAEPIVTRAIPSSGERLPSVGLGTARVFDSDDAATLRAATEVLRALVDGGGRLVDTASSYGDAEQVLGRVLAATGLRERTFIATKLEAADTSELDRSLKRLGVARVDLLQLHNVRDPRQSLAQFRDWKAQGRCRYIGITSTYHGDFAALEAVLGREKPDFVQVDYSLDNHDAQQRTLSRAADVGAGVLTALPFGRGRLFRAVRGRAIPDWAQGFAASWAQFFLKYLIADDRVTAVIPGTADARHMTDNLGAMRGALPDAGERQRMVAYIESL